MGIPKIGGTDIMVGIGIPSDGNWRDVFGSALAQMVACWSAARYVGGRKGTEFLAYTGKLPQVRNVIVAEAIKRGCTHLLWLDSDMTFPADTVQQLLRQGKLAVGANYSRRSGHPLIPTAADLNGDPVYTTDESAGLEKVGHLGLGCLMVDMQVFTVLEPPFFEFRSLPPYFLDVETEDVFFCRQLRRHDIDVWCDHDLSKHVGHVAEVVYRNQMLAPRMPVRPAANSA